jgi:uncharacterized protein (DUF58 family)
MVAEPPPLPSPTGRGSTPPPLPGTAARIPSGPLDLSLLRDLPNLEVQTRCLVDGMLGGRHRSPLKGSSVEFAEYRDYQFGDDIRRIDWRLYGRTDRIHLRQYEEETQMRLFLVLDTSASMQYRSPRASFSKAHAARLALAATALLARRQQDAYGLALVGESVEDFLPARATPSHWRTFLSRLDALSIGGPTRLAGSLHRLAELLPRRSLVIIASDFYEEAEALETALHRLRYDHHDVVGFHVIDPMEADLQDDLHGTLVDMETGQRLDLETPAVRIAYRERFTAFCQSLDRSFGLMHGERFALPTDQSPLQALSAFWAGRNGRA